MDVQTGASACCFRRPLFDIAAMLAQTERDQLLAVVDLYKALGGGWNLTNSEWMYPMDAVGLVRLASHVTVKQILERDDFDQRFSENRPLALHEVLYPLVMGYDSVALEADVELVEELAMASHELSLNEELHQRMEHVFHGEWHAIILISKNATATRPPSP